MKRNFEPFDREDSVCEDGLMSYSCVCQEGFMKNSGIFSKALR